MRHRARRSAAESEESMGVTEMPRIELAGGRRSALDYPNILRVEPGDGRSHRRAPHDAGDGPLPHRDHPAVRALAARQRRARSRAAPLQHRPGGGCGGDGPRDGAGGSTDLDPSRPPRRAGSAHRPRRARRLRSAAARPRSPRPLSRRCGARWPRSSASREGLCGGRGGSMHLADAAAGVSTSAIVGGGIPAAAGGALAAKLRANGERARRRRSETERPGDRCLPRVGCPRPGLGPAADLPAPEQPLLRRDDPPGDRGLRGPRDPRGWLRHAGPDRGRHGPDRHPGGDGGGPRARHQRGARARRGSHLSLLPSEWAAAGERVQVPDEGRGAAMGRARSRGRLPSTAGRGRSPLARPRWSTFGTSPPDVVGALRRRGHRIDAGRRPNPARAIPGPQHDRERDPRPRPAARGRPS